MEVTDCLSILSNPFKDEPRRSTLIREIWRETCSVIPQGVKSASISLPITTKVGRFPYSWIW